MSIIEKRKARIRQLAIARTKVRRTMWEVADRYSGSEAQRLTDKGKPVYFVNAKLSQHILRQQPNGVVEEVEMTPEGNVHVLGTLVRDAGSAAAVGHRRTQRSR